MPITRELLAQSWRSWYSNDIRRVGPEWLQLVWTVLFAAAIAAAFTLLGFALNRHSDWQALGTWGRWYRVNFVVSLSVALCIHALFALLIPLVGPDRIRRFSHGRRALFFTAVPVTGVMIGWPLGVWLISERVGGWARLSAESLFTSAVLALFISFILFLFFNSMARRVQAEKRATEAQLRLLQAQIEPHFLFNTLANVHSLMDHDPPLARQMLSAFTDYLRASLGALRNDDATLAQELELARCYLQLLQMRMPDRLQFTIQADEALCRQPLPPLLLQPLVENAVVHGLEPSIEGGHVEVRVSRLGNTLLLEVQDDGLGLDTAPRPGLRRGGGLALANIRQRLMTRYGSQARLEVSPAHPGTLARISLPLERT